MDRTERNIKLSSCTATLEHGGHWRQRNVSLVVHSVEQVLCYIHKFKETPAAVQPAVAYLCKTISCNTVQTLLMMSENMARNMQSSQGIINTQLHYPTRLHLIGHFHILGIEYLYPSFFEMFKKYFEVTLACCVFEKVHLLKKCFIKLIIHEFVSSDYSGDEFIYKPW